MRWRKRGRIVYFLGNDGTGKTTQAELLLARLREGSVPARYVWLRFPHFVSAPVLILSRLLGVTRYRTVGGQRQGAWEFYRARPLAWALLWCQVVDAAIFRAIKLEPALWRGEVIVLDRFVYDIVVDIAAAARDAGILSSLPARLLYGLLSRGEVVLLDADSEAIRERRPDLAADALHGLKSDLYRRIARLRGIRVLDATAPPAAIAEQVSQYAGVTA